MLMLLEKGNNYSVEYYVTFVVFETENELL